MRALILGVCLLALTGCASLFGGGDTVTFERGPLLRTYVSLLVKYSTLRVYVLEACKAKGESEMCQQGVALDQQLRPVNDAILNALTTPSGTVDPATLQHGVDLLLKLAGLMPPI